MVLAVAGLLKLTRGSIEGPGSAGTENRVGRARLAGHLDRRVSNAAPTARTKFANQELFTDEEGPLSTSNDRLFCAGTSVWKRGSERDVAGVYNAGVPVGEAYGKANVADRAIRPTEGFPP